MKCIDYCKAGFFERLFGKLEHKYKTLLISPVVPARSNNFYTDGMLIKKYIRSEGFLICRYCGEKKVEEYEFPAALVREAQNKNE